MTLSRGASSLSTVAAIDDDVTGREQRTELGDRRLGRLARGHHHPAHAWRRELLDDLGERERRLRAVALERFHAVRTHVERDHFVAAFHEPPRHVRAHAAQSDHR
jgi:hypothetical protein